MDPVTLALLAALPAVLGTTQGIVNSTTNNEQQRHNRDALARLQAAEAGGNLGLTGAERQAMTNAYVSPIQQSAASMRARAEQAQAASGGLSGQALEDLRNAQARQVGQAQQAAVAQVQQANLAAQDRQRNEIEQRLALKGAMRQDDVNAIFGGLSQLAGPVGALAGAPPGTTQAAGLFGGKALGGSEREQLRAFKEQNPDEYQALLEELVGAGGGL